jgi:hypothetical protein
MNQHRGSRAMSLLGHVVKMDVDTDGKASGVFLRAKIAIEIDKPLRRGVLLRMNKGEEPKWFATQFEKLPFYCYSCGIMGHSEIECPNPVPRDEMGKLPYDVQLRALEERKRRVQTFAGQPLSPLGLAPLLHQSTLGGSPTIQAMIISPGGGGIPFLFL